MTGEVIKKNIEEIKLVAQNEIEHKLFFTLWTHGSFSRQCLPNTQG